MTTPTTPNSARLEPDLGRAVERRALRDGVYDAILELLLEGRVKPGGSLSIDALARQLGVSPTPVREAMVQLEHTGLVTRAALKGYRVAPPLSADRMSELVDARTILEVAAVRGAVPMSDGALLELKAAHSDHVMAAEYVKRLRATSDETSWPVIRRYYTADWAFHRVILHHCGNQYLLQLAEGLSPQVHRMRQSLGHGLTDVDQAVAEHGVILEAIATGDDQRAEDAMRAHLLGVRARSLAES
ncbi:GntR family transcriptional regulator [Micromonospora sp. NPDC007230]|uniref:GntR family transcriptional regulator n=1 Tax=Micromonospora sp. NPDC007230 TaxID=3364237 RepID=UPI0036A16E65